MGFSKPAAFPPSTRNRNDPHRRRIRTLILIALVSVVGLALALRGWNSRHMLFDNANFIEGAEQLLTDGILPERGDVSSYRAFATPGTSWLLLPGMLIFDDPRLYEFVGSAALYVGTLAGVFLLAEMCFGLRCAFLSILLYGLSRNGLFYAGSLWSIGHPFFYVWTVYFCFRWVKENNSNSLAAALTIWAAGMYVDMVVAPIVFLFPVLWLIYRPPVRIVPLAVAGILTLAIWYPYLRFEHERQYADLKSLVTRQRSPLSNFKEAWCMPDLILRSASTPTGISDFERQNNSPQTPSQSARTVGQKVGERMTIAFEAGTFNFDQMAWSPRAFVPLVLIGLSTILVIALQWIAGTPNHLVWISRFAGCLFLTAFLLNEIFLAQLLTPDGTLESSTRWRIRAIQVLLLIIGMAILIPKKAVMDFVVRLRLSENGSLRDQTLFALSLMVPWLALILVAEQGRPERYWWLWPLQTVAIVAAVTYFPVRLGWRSAIVWTATLALTVALLIHPWIAVPVQSWFQDGWSGTRAEDIEAMDYLASQILSEGNNTASIGYQIYTYAFLPIFHAVDPTYKVGADLDLFLKHRYGISNTDQCAEGISPTDEYRILELRAATPASDDYFSEQPNEYFDISPDPRFRLIRQFGNYQVYKRVETSQLDK